MIPKRLTIHCSASANGKKWDIASIRKEHMTNRGFSDVGYHYVIQPDGEVQLGRGLNIQGAHVEGDNEDNVGICMIGTDKFTAAQFDSLLHVWDSLRRSYPFPLPGSGLRTLRICVREKNRARRARI
jgi:N-acetylmuramoyl-L-alanine amidase